MVQGEINAVTPNVQNGASSNVARLYENVSNIQNNAHNVNLNGSDAGGEKKKKVGNYIISKTIGEGSFAKVRLGYHLITQQMVAVKVINKREVLKRNYLRANLRREACMMQRMQHPHIIQLFEVMETENCYYIVMELIDGIEFVKYLSKKRSLDENETRQYIRQICSAVDHMHKAKVVHRDIKLQNFMLDQTHNLTIIDFGLSNSLDDREFLNTQCGSPAYAAPEIFAHQDYGVEVDIWSIGVNMYAMLAGKLPFKVENRSKNLAKLHACILKGFELPPFLSPDCQDLLCRLLDPSPSKRIKMSEIFTHPWINYNCFPVEIIPYKPVVDIKEIKPQIVQYIVQKHDYTETDVIDAIVYRKPVALKAVYYLIDKRLKQGLSFPETDYLPDNENISLKPPTSNNSNSNLNNNGLFNNSNANVNYSLNNHIPTNTNGITKQNSQLLPKRHGVQVATRSGSQKNVDFKSIFNNMNSGNSNLNRYGSNVSRESDRVQGNNNNSNSPSPDFIAAAMTPAKNTSNLSNNLNANPNSASSQRNTRPANFLDITQRKLNSNTSNYSTTNTINNNNNTNEIQIRIPSSAASITNQNESKADRYYMPVSSNNNGSNNKNRNSPSSEESYQPVIYYQQQQENNMRTIGGLINNSANNATVSRNPSNGIGGMRSLPSSLYRGSPERSLPRSPERQENGSTFNHNNYRPASRISSSRPSVSETSDKNFDAQKYKIANYLASKRSLTSCDEAAFDAKQKVNSNIVKNRQLQMGKAKIDLETQTNLNVGISIKNIGNYLKSSASRPSPDNLKSYNSLNIKTTSNNLKNNSAASNSGSTLADSKQRQGSNLVHRHSNPSGSTNSNTINQNTNAKSRVLQPTSTSISDSTANALPRIRINS